MRNRSGLVVLAALALCGCASLPETPVNLPSPTELQSDPNGSWIAVQTTTELQVGELLAVVNDSTLYVKTRDPYPIRIDVARVKSAHMVRYDPHAGAIVGLAFLGTLSTISNGYLLVLTAPTWIIAGTAASVSRSHDPQLNWPGNSWGEFRPYARFPAGLPAAFASMSQYPAPVMITRDDTTEVSAAAPPAPAPAPGAHVRHFALHFALGPGYHKDVEGNFSQTDLGFIFGIDAELARAVFLGTRLAMAPRDYSVSQFTQFSEFNTAGESFDLALVGGLQWRIHRLRMAAGLGPAAYGASIGEVFDLNFSLAWQGELSVDVTRSVALGGTFAYNDNEIRDFYVVAFGVRFVVW